MERFVDIFKERAHFFYEEESRSRVQKYFIFYVFSKYSILYFRPDLKSILYFVFWNAFLDVFCISKYFVMYFAQPCQKHICTKNSYIHCQTRICSLDGTKDERLILLVLVMRTCELTFYERGAFGDQD